MGINVAGYIGDVSEDDSEFAFYFTTTGSVGPVDFDTAPGGITIYKYVGAAEGNNVTPTAIGGWSLTLNTPGTGTHRVVIDLSNAWYETEADYAVLLDDGYLGAFDATRFMIATFSIENRTIGAIGPVAADTVRDLIISDNNPFLGASIAQILSTAAASAGIITANQVAIAALPADVKADVLEIFDTDATTEVTSPPTITSPYGDQLQWLFANARNEVVINKTAGTKVLKDDAGTSDIATSTITDTGTVYTRTEQT